MRLVREILPHVSDCEGLSIMVETLPEDHVRQVLAARDTAHEQNLDLFAWAASSRGQRA